MKKLKSVATENADNGAVNNSVDNELQVDNKPKEVIKPRRRDRVSQQNAVRFNVDKSFGLTTEQVTQRYKQSLSNQVKSRNSKSIPAIIFGNTFTFFNFLCALVIVAYAVVSSDIANFTFIIPFACNLIIGIYQEIRAKLSIEKLSILQAPVTKVIRNGVEEQILTSELVLDDVFTVVSGNQIPVDGVVLGGYAEVNESLLTGESIPIKKQEGDYIMAGSFVTSGSVIAKADKIAEECYVQKITSTAKKYKKTNSELMRTLTWIVKIIGLIIVPTAIGIGIVNYKNPIDTTNVAKFVVERTGTVILGMIPAGLILLTTIALSLGVIRLYKRNTLVQDMYSLEMLARVDVLCLDKTGTITDGRMQVIKDITFAHNLSYSLDDIIGTMQSVFDDSNATSQALRARYVPTQDFTVLKTLPFSSARKHSAVTFSEIGTYAIGAPEFVLNDIPQTIKEQIDHYTTLGNRVLILAHSTAQITPKNTLPNSMKPVAMIVLSDNIRPEAIETIKWFKDNDVEVKVISGDNPITVSEIARRAGIENASNWISLEGLSDKEIVSIADQYTVFGRVSPDQKSLLIKALKLSGHTVAMTGDGVNDILAMRESDCSITVASGADAAKSVAHIVLADNNFNSMPKVVAEGRRVINNIKQSASLFLMKTIFVSLLAFISIATMSPFPFETRHLTMLEMFVIGFASLALSLQPNERRVEGDFLTTIFSNAIPGGLLLLMNVYLIKFMHLFGVFKTEDFSMTMQVVAFTFGGIIYLYKISKPFNVIRSIIFTIVLAVISLWTIFLLDTTSLGIGNFFGLNKLFPLTTENWEYPLVIFTIVELDLLLVEPLSNFNKFIFGSFRKGKK